MRKLLVVLVVVGLASFIISCGSSSKTSTSKDSAGNSPKESQTSGKKLDVSGKECPGGSSKLTSKDLVEAFVLNLCDMKAKNEPNTWGSLRLSPLSEAQIKFVSLSQKSTGPDGSVTLNYGVKLTDCPQCPRDFYGELRLSKNSAEEWQIANSAWGFVSETEESYHAAVLRLISVTISTDTAEFKGNNQYFDLSVKISGDQKLVNQVIVQAQFEDGRILEFHTEADQNWSRFWSTGSGTWKDGSKVKILAYTFEVEDLEYNKKFRPDWIPVKVE